MISSIWEGGAHPLLISLQTTEAPSDEAWDGYVALLEELNKRAGFETMSGLSLTDGGTPGVMQRAKLNKIIGNRSVPGAVVSDAQAIQGVVAALNYFNPKVKAFSPTQWSAIVAHIGVGDEQLPSLWAELARLDARLGGITTMGKLRAAARQAAVA